MAKVIVKNNNLDKALNIFKNRVESENILKDYRAKQFYQSKGDIKRKQIKDAKRKQYIQRLKQERLDKTQSL